MLRASVSRFYLGYRGFSTASNTARIGFIGLGNMGGGMAANLCKAGHQLSVFDVSTKNCEALKSEFGNTQIRSSPAQIAAECDTIITMLPEDGHVTSVYTDSEKGILKTVRPGSLLIDSSTISPATAQKISKLALEKKASHVDAPVSGGIVAAKAGTLAFMVGGSEESFKRAEPYLALMGKKIVYCGDSGNGLVAKICNNLILMISMIGVSEGFNLAVRYGMDPKLLANVVNASSGRCWSSELYNPVPGVVENIPSSRGYAGGFGADLAKKDLSLAVSAAMNLKTPLPMGSLAHNLYAVMSEKGEGHLDFSGIYHTLYGSGGKPIEVAKKN
eukprot:TRINITY_DN7619_c0_g1::TRINITY_DN7619_c0_g1_i1::g.18603::m.18603 TRINITY_DN7619_c0_g1::TRINITY_DN7619_c0_g1_i1::g.18603  ORF type:complete len:331 (+),score=121.92,sp/Q54CX6/3HIDH_DICDI/55.15/1e-107,NAD_binding_2/PF03446.10/2.9e-50,NAD_binding_11/PF14833.1/6.8e-34,F420_oxidored/PF03807.12/2.2e-09,UDPG_MGDP_dh_N/PF03721.9/0.0045,UDPG_MGDP_dh_N/PF03721.9/9,3HCDH_N/PF02737.13/0.00021,3HCDH_N/PF02737.13/2.4e+03,2-Hacid_dh_C/PF02826.14/0.00021,NAD_Gly3P_dh_N/PF01210.18/0.01,TrkA_N/PF02254.13/0.02,ApbA